MHPFLSASQRFRWMTVAPRLHALVRWRGFLETMTARPPANFDGGRRYEG